MSGIIWIASYPKSGNTWFRTLLTNFLRNTTQPAHINDLEVSWIASDRSVFDDALGVESSDLSDDEILRLRPEVYRHMATRSAETLFWKIHDAYNVEPCAETVIPADVTLGAVYLVRNPLDVSVSFAHHSRWTLDETIESMSQNTMTLSGNPGRLAPRLKQHLVSWSNHVLSWIGQTVIPVHVVRYEDLCDRPFETFRGAVNFLGLPDDPERLTRSISFSAFDVLQRQEQTLGFKERPAKAEAFFRRGQQGTWRESLSEEQITRIVQDHGAVMRRTGYLL